MVAKLTGLTLLVATLALFSLSRGAEAQYPPPTGSVTLTSSSSGSPTGGVVLLTSRVLDTSGAPIAGAAVTFSIISEPGIDAAVGSKVITLFTDANGFVTDNLRVGSTSGTILVGATSGGMSSQIIVQVAGQSAPFVVPVYPVYPPLGAVQPLYQSPNTAPLPPVSSSYGYAGAPAAPQAASAPSAALPPAAPVQGFAGGFVITPPNTGDGGLLAD